MSVKNLFPHGGIKFKLISAVPLSCEKIKLVGQLNQKIRSYMPQIWEHFDIRKEIKTCSVLLVDLES